MSSTRKAMKKPKGRLHRLLLNPSFPLTFLLRNLLTLQAEPGWAKLPSRLRRASLSRLLAERSLFFLEVCKWRLARNHADLGNLQSRSECSGDPGPPPGYCSHCGACCEIASGLPDFPLTDEIPDSWMEAFGEGLGRGHRFCAFLLEERPLGRSLCAIHRWRPNPCRDFEQDECEYLMQHQGFFPPLRDRRISVARRWLFRLIDAGKLPRRRADFPAKSPKLLKFHGV